MQVETNAFACYIVLKNSTKSIHLQTFQRANPSFIKSLKIHWGERPDYENEKKEYYKYMKVEPISFAKEHKE
ncbi:MAG: hypothetical protein WBW34_06015, partial [Nitrososphaeraceae archaeon]